MRIPRLPWDQFFMLHAHLAATRSTCDRGPSLLFDPGRHGVGCVIVKDHRIIAGGYNGSPPGHPHCNDPDLYHECQTGHKFLPTAAETHRRGIGKMDECPVCGHLDRVYVYRGYGGHLIRDGHCVRTIHSEANAILQCALHGVSPEGSIVYTTASPCYDCAKLLCGAKVSQVVYGESYNSRYGLSSKVESLLHVSDIECKQLVLVLNEAKEVCCES